MEVRFCQFIFLFFFLTKDFVNHNKCHQRLFWIAGTNLDKALDIGNVQFKGNTFYTVKKQNKYSESKGRRNIFKDNILFSRVFGLLSHFLWLERRFGIVQVFQDKWEPCFNKTKDFKLVEKDGTFKDSQFLHVWQKCVKSCKHILFNINSVN